MCSLTVCQLEIIISLKKLCTLNKINVAITAGKMDGSLHLGLFHFLFSLQCAGHSVCNMECVVGSGMQASDIKWDAYRYHGSIDIDYQLENARFFSLTLKASRVEGIELRVILEKVQHCDYNVPEKHVRHLRYRDCDVIKLANSIYYANFLTQPTQVLNIGINPICPIKHCIDMTVTVTDTVSGMSVEERGVYSYEWRHTLLEHVPIKVTVPGYVKISWTNLDLCKANHESMTLCDVWMNITSASKSNFDNGAVLLHKEENYLISKISSHIHLLFLKA